VGENLEKRGDTLPATDPRGGDEAKRVSSRKELKFYCMDLRCATSSAKKARVRNGAARSKEQV
jgi:hypothetical protein